MLNLKKGGIYVITEDLTSLLLEGTVVVIEKIFDDGQIQIRLECPPENAIIDTFKLHPSLEYVLFFLYWENYLE